MIRYILGFFRRRRVAGKIAQDVLRETSSCSSIRSGNIQAPRVIVPRRRCGAQLRHTPAMPSEPMTKNSRTTIPVFVASMRVRLGGLRLVLVAARPVFRQLAGRPSSASAVVRWAASRSNNSRFLCSVARSRISAHSAASARSFSARAPSALSGQPAPCGFQQPIPLLACKGAAALHLDRTRRGVEIRARPARSRSVSYRSRRPCPQRGYRYRRGLSAGFWSNRLIQ